MNRQTNNLYAFGRFQFDSKERLLQRDGIPVPLAPKVADTLFFLVHNAGHLVDKDELMKQVWPDAFVEEGNLNKNIFVLRKALGQWDGGREYIETIPKRGYRFVAPVETSSPPRNLPVSEDADTLARQGIGNKRHSLVSRLGVQISIAATLIAAFASMALVALNPNGSWPRLYRKKDTSAIRSIAVLPLRNFSGDPDQDYFADGLTDELIARLAKLSAIKVISHTSMMHYRKTEKTIPEIARELNVDAVLEGSIVRSGERIKVTAQMIRASTDEHLWAETYERDLRDVLALQADLSSTIAHQIGITMTQRERSDLDRVLTVNPNAYDAYLRGRFQWGNYTEQGLRDAVVSLQEAIRLDPSLSSGYSALARSYQELAYYVQPKEVVPMAQQAAVEALRLDDCNAEAHTVRGWIKLHYDWDFAGAEAEYKRGIECEPWASQPHDEYATYLDTMGRLDDSQREHKIALERDPVSVLTRVHYADSFFYARRYDMAEKEYEEIVRLDPGSAVAHLSLGFVYLQQSKFDRGIEELETTMQLDPGSGTIVAVAHAISGDRIQVRRMLPEILSSAKTRYVSGVNLALIYTALGKPQDACQWLEKSYKDRDPDIAFFNVDPSLDSIRSTECFRNITRRVGFY